MKRNRAYYVESYHEPEKKRAVADLWFRDQVVAVGFSLTPKDKTQLDSVARKDDVIDILKSAQGNAYGAEDLYKFIKLRKGDLMLVGIGGGKIAFVGEIISPSCSFNISKDTGEEYAYRYQRKIRVWHAPIYFHNTDLELPETYLEKVKQKPHKTLTKIDVPFEILAQALEKLREDTSLDWDEEGIKQYLRCRINYRHPVDGILKGLKIIDKEYHIKPVGRADFFGEVNNRPALIEVKTIGDSSSVGQLLAYMNGYRHLKGVNPIGILLARKIEETAKIAAEGLEMALVECNPPKFKFGTIKEVTP